MAHYIMSAGAIPVMLPTTVGPWSYADLLRGLDGLVLQGGSDVAPQSYGESPLRPEWSGDAVRDAYEIELIKASVSLGIPVFGICRGAQVINVAFGGTLYQDINTQRADTLIHRDHGIYDQNFHNVTFGGDSKLYDIFGKNSNHTINSVHHQAIKDVGKGLHVEARAPDDTIEAVRLHDNGAYVFGVQWHPEFQDPNDASLLDRKPILEDFLAAARARAA